MKLSSQIFILVVTNVTIIAQLTTIANPYYIYQSKAEECTILIEVVNRTVSETKEASSYGGGKTPDSIDKLVKIFDKASNDISSLNISDERLRTYRSQFLAMYQGASKISKKLVYSINKRNLAKVKKHLREYSNIVSSERDIVEGLNTYCKI